MTRRPRGIAMIRSTACATLIALSLAVTGCATTAPAGYADGSYAGPYDGGYYAAAHNGYGDYYYDRPEVVYDDYGFYPGFGFGFGYGYGPWGFGYNPWYYRPGWGPWWGWGGWHHHHHHWDGHAWPHVAHAGAAPQRMPVQARSAPGAARGERRSDPVRMPSRGGGQKHPVR